MTPRAAALVSIAIALIVAGCGGGGGETGSVASTATATPDEVQARRTATRVENLAQIEAAVAELDSPNARVEDAMAELARIQVEIAYLRYGSDLCDVVRDDFPSLTTVSSKAEAAELFVDAIYSDLSDFSLNEQARMAELYV